VNRRLFAGGGSGRAAATCRVAQGSTRWCGRAGR
jgi:hypothetical protein